MNRTKLKIHTWPEKILRRKCRKVKKIIPEVKLLFDEMCELMRENKGVGLAANQVGLDLCLVTVELEGRLFKLVNPRIIKSGGSICFTEGCLSFPGLELKIRRKNQVLVSALDESGKQLKIKAEGLLAVIFQHEIDHIQGKAFIDRIPFWQRVRILARLKQIAAETKQRLKENP